MSKSAKSEAVGRVAMTKNGLAGSRNPRPTLRMEIRDGMLTLTAPVKRMPQVSVRRVNGSGEVEAHFQSPLLTNLLDSSVGSRCRLHASVVKTPRGQKEIEVWMQSE